VADNGIAVDDLLRQFPGGVAETGAAPTLLRYSPSETKIFGEWAEQQF
jgi:hypothetical protein